MPSLTGLLLKWPLIRQIRERADGTGMEAMSDKTRCMRGSTTLKWRARFVHTAELVAGSSFFTRMENSFPLRAIRRVRSARAIFAPKVQLLINC